MTKVSEEQSRFRLRRGFMNQIEKFWEKNTRLYVVVFSDAKLLRAVQAVVKNSTVCAKWFKGNGSLSEELILRCYKSPC